jgi:lauroyl/myristoyl acyltransferase
MYLQNPTDDDFKLKESHVESMLNKNLSSVLPDFFNNEEENLTEIMFENVKEFVIELNNDYSNNWYHRYDILKQELNENEERMQLLDEEIADLKSCVEELEECRSFVQN